MSFINIWLERNRRKWCHQLILLQLQALFHAVSLICRQRFWTCLMIFLSFLFFKSTNTVGRVGRHPSLTLSCPCVEVYELLCLVWIRADLRLSSMSEVDFLISCLTDFLFYVLSTISPSYVWDSDINNRQFQRRIIAVCIRRSERHAIRFVIGVVTISGDSVDGESLEGQKLQQLISKMAVRGMFILNF